MAFTATDLTNLEAAIRTLTTGGATFVQIGDRSYRKEDLKALREQYDWMKTHITADTDNGIYKVSFKSKAEL